MGILDSLGTSIGNALAASAKPRDSVKELEFAQQGDIDRAININKDIVLEKQKYRINLEKAWKDKKIPQHFIDNNDGDEQAAQAEWTDYYKKRVDTRTANPLDETISTFDIYKINGEEALAGYLNKTDFARSLLGNGKFLGNTSTIGKNPETGEWEIRPDVNTVDPETGEIRTTAMTDDGSRVRDLTDEERGQKETRGISFSTLDELEKGFSYEVKKAAGVDRSLALVTNPYLGDAAGVIFDPTADRQLKAQLIQEKEAERKAAEDANAPIQEAIGQAEEVARQRAEVEKFKAEEEAAGRPVGAPAEAPEAPEASLATSVGPYKGFGENTEGKELLYDDALVSTVDKFVRSTFNSKYVPNYVATPGQKHPFDMTDVQWNGLTPGKKAQYTRDEKRIVDMTERYEKNELDKKLASSYEDNASTKDVALVKGFYNKTSAGKVVTLLQTNPEKLAEFRADPYNFALNNSIEDLQGGKPDPKVSKIISNIVKDPEIKLSKIDQAIKDGDVETLKGMLKKIPEVLTEADYNTLVADNQQRQGNMASYAKKQRQILYMSYLSNLGDFDNPESVGAKTLAAFNDGKSNALFYETGQWDLAAEELAVKQEGNRLRADTNKISRDRLVETIAENNRKAQKELEANYQQYSDDGRAHRNNMIKIVDDIDVDSLADSSANSNLNNKLSDAITAERNRLSNVISVIEKGGDLGSIPQQAITDYIAFQGDEALITKIKLVDELEQTGFIYSLIFDPKGSVDAGFIDEAAGQIREWFFQPSQPARVGEGGPSPKFILGANKEPIVLTKTELPDGRSVYGPEAYAEVTQLINSGQPLLIEMPNGATVDARKLEEAYGADAVGRLIIDAQRFSEGI